MQDYDDSSDEEGVVELSGEKISESWERFASEVSKSLVEQINALNKEIEGSEAAANTLYSFLKKLKVVVNGNPAEEEAAVEDEAKAETLQKRIASALDSVNQVKEKISAFQFQFPQDKLKNIENIKSVITNFSQEIGEVLKPIYDKYNAIVEEIGDCFLLPQCRKKISEGDKRIRFTARQSKEKNDAKLTNILNDRLKWLSEWVEVVKNDVEEIRVNLSYAESVFKNLDVFLESSTPKLERNIELSFIAHFVGTGLLHHTKVKEVYQEEKRKNLGSEDLSKKFHYEVLKSGLVMNTVVEFLRVCGKCDISFCDQSELPGLVLMLGKEENLRRLFKMMNGINDFIFFRRIYDYVDQSRISFAQLLKMSIKEIIEHLVSQYPILKAYSAQVIYIAANDFDSERDDIQIDTAEEVSAYRYKNQNGYIEDSTNEQFVRECVVLQGRAVPEMVKTIYLRLLGVSEDNSEKSLKEYYLAITGDDLVESTLNLVSGLPQREHFDIKMLRRKPDDIERKKIACGRLTVLEKVPESQEAYTVHYSSPPREIQEARIEITSDELSPVSTREDATLAGWITDKISESFEFNEYKNVKWLMDFVIKKLEETGCKLVFSKDDLKGRFLNVLFREEEVAPLGENFLQHVFLLIFKKNFYNTMGLMRTVLPDTFTFSVASPPEFLSAIRLCNRSLTRLSRNLLQNTSTLLQVEQINSGSNPLVSVARTWHFAENEAENLQQDSFFAVDRQMVNTKRSEKKTTLLSREHYVAEVGSYSSIHDALQKELVTENPQDQARVQVFMHAVFLGNRQLNFYLKQNSKLNARFFFSNLYYLVFGVESIRNPAMFVLNPMLIELVQDGLIKIEQLFHGSGIVEIGVGKEQFVYMNGLIPTAPKLITARSRELNNLFHRYMPNPYIYPGDLSREQNGFPSDASVLDKSGEKSEGRKELKLKLGLNHLIYREALVMTMWCKQKGIKIYNADGNVDVKAVGNEVISCAQKFWKLDGPQ